MQVANVPRDLQKFADGALDAPFQNFNLVLIDHI
eukprot:SAG31_NODE_1946_length_6844_cov_5.947665_9_plen_34_part_00